MAEEIQDLMDISEFSESQYLDFNTDTATTDTQVSTETNTEVEQTQTETKPIDWFIELNKSIGTNYSNVDELISAEGKGVVFGFNLVARPSQEDTQMLLNYVNTALQTGKNGVAGITISEAMTLVRRIQEGAQWEEIETYISFKEKQREQEQQAYQQQSAHQQGLINQQYAQQNAENERIKVQMEAEKEAYVYSAKAYYDMILSDKQTYNKMLEIQAQNGTIQMPTPPQLTAPDTTIDGMSQEQIARNGSAECDKPGTLVGSPK